MNINEEWVKARCADDCGCLVWQMHVSRDGAPLTQSPFKDGRRYKVQVRRLVWEMRNGPIPEGMLVTCACANARCLTCLKLATHAEINARNWARPDVKARHVASLTKAARAQGKLDMDKARYIRSSPATLKEVSREMGISMTLASQIRRGILWKESGNPFAGLGA